MLESGLELLCNPERLLCKDLAGHRFFFARKFAEDSEELTKAIDAAVDQREAALMQT